MPENDNAVGAMNRVKISQNCVAVDPHYEWRDIATAPRGVKLQLLGAGGVACYGTYDGKDGFWLAWAPCPMTPEWLKERLSAQSANPAETG